MNFLEECSRGVSVLWESIVSHPFLRELAKGVLPGQKFSYYLAQDDYYLEDLLSTLGLLVAKADEKPLKVFAARLLSETIAGEVAMHETIEKEGYAHPFSKGEIARQYGDFLLRTAYEEDALGILVAISPCFFTYRDIGVRWIREVNERTPQVYRLWLEVYAGEAYRDLVDTLRGWVCRKASLVSPSRKEKLFGTFRWATILEYRFWQESYTLDVDSSLT